MNQGSEIVPRLGVRKQAILNAGGSVFDMAVAMLETKGMIANYPFGDVYPNGQPKIDDAANFGIFKQCWLMIRSSVPQYASLTAQQFRSGAAMNNNLSWDIQVLHASQRHYGMDRWIAGHRGGLSGLNGTWSQNDIINYRTAINWIQSQINSNAKFRADDTRFWVDVPPV